MVLWWQLKILLRFFTKVDGKFKWSSQQHLPSADPTETPENPFYINCKPKDQWFNMLNAPQENSKGKWRIADTVQHYIITCIW